MPVPETASPVPAAPNARVVTLDILRGFALLGMILAHFHKTMGVATSTIAANPIGWVITMLVAEKDRAIFAFLFGVSFAIMIRRLETKGLPVVVTFLRRLVVLYLLGFAVETLTHFAILREYAFWGVPLLFLQKCTTRSLIVFALISVSAFSVREIVDAGYAAAIVGRHDAVVREAAHQKQWESAQRTEAQAMMTMSYPEVVATRARRLIHDLPRFNTITPGINMALFILGLLAIRHGIFDDPKRHLRVILPMMALGLLGWVAQWWVLSAVPADLVSPRIAIQIRKGFGFADEQFLAFAFIGAITLLIAQWPRWKSLLAPFAWVGRIALTNYVMQAGLIELASAPYGFGLRISPGEEALGAAMLFGLQIAFSRIWLSHFQYGPFEWVWRTITYWKWQPMRVTVGEPN